MLCLMRFYGLKSFSLTQLWGGPKTMLSDGVLQGVSHHFPKNRESTIIGANEKARELAGIGLENRKLEEVFGKGVPMDGIEELGPQRLRITASTLSFPGPRNPMITGRFSSILKGPTRQAGFIPSSKKSAPSFWRFSKTPTRACACSGPREGSTS